MKRVTALLVVFPLAAVAAAGAARADVSQTPVATACPTGYPLRSVASFGWPYRVPGEVDAAGNNDGFVCARAEPDAVRDVTCNQGGTVACLLEEFGLPIYLFLDDNNSAYESAQVGG